MNTPKRQHTSPRVYLKNFVESDGRLTVFSKRTGKVMRPLPKDALVRWFYYSQPLNGELNAEHGIETKLFQELEDRYNDLYLQLLRGACEDLDVLFQTLPMMRARSPGFREAFELGLADMVERTVKSLPEDILPPPPEGMPDILDKISVSIDPHRSLIAMAFYIKNYCDAIALGSFKVAAAPNGTEFLTSDNPVIWFEKGAPLGNEVIYSTRPTPQTRVFFPLNKKLALIGRLRRKSEPPFRLGIMHLSRSSLRTANAMQMACAWDIVIGTEKMASRIEKYCSGVAPAMNIATFFPEKNEFVLGEHKLAPLRPKNKFNHSAEN